MNILEEKIAILAEAKELLAERKKESELSYEQQNTLEYLEKFAKLTPKQSESLKEKLVKLEILNEKQVGAIVNIVPTKEEVIRTVLSRGKLEFSSEQMKEILKITKEFEK